MSPGEAEGVFTGELAILAAGVVYVAWKPVRRAWGAVRAAGQKARAWWRRLVPLTPPGRRHERHVRKRLGMPPAHPEHVTRPDGRVHAEALAALQEELWPEGEWVDVIRMHLEGP